MKIGVFDSGVGGITVLTELKRTLPQAEFVYLGDTAHVPYGAKSPAQIERFSTDCARTLKQLKVDVLVVACNTASSWALPAIRREMGAIPVMGVVEPGVEAAISALPTTPADAIQTPVMVLATRATVNSHAYGTLLRQRLPGAQVIEQACPLLVPIIEEGWLDHDILHLTIQEYVGSYLTDAKPGVALLGCTHYPWIHKAFENALPGWAVVNSAQAIAKALERASITANSAAQPGAIQWIFTDPDAVPAFAKNLIRDQGWE